MQGASFKPSMWPVLRACTLGPRPNTSSRRRGAGPAGARGRRAGHARLPALLARVRRARAGGRAARRRAARVPARRPRLRLGQGAAPARPVSAQGRLAAVPVVRAAGAGSPRRRAASRCPAVHPRVRLTRGITDSNYFHNNPPPCRPRARPSLAFPMRRACAGRGAGVPGCGRVWDTCRSRAVTQAQAPPD